jgi:hypothetical protein
MRLADGTENPFVGRERAFRPVERKKRVLRGLADFVIRGIDKINAFAE